MLQARAQNRTRTCTAVRPLVPETSVSTNFTIWADGKSICCDECPGQDSNLHILKDTSPSSWRVYQFHHLGKAGAKIIFFQNIKQYYLNLFFQKDYTRRTSKLYSQKLAINLNFYHLILISQLQ